MRGPGFLAVLLAVAAAVLLRRRAAAQRDERDLWTEAGIAPDLR